MHAAFHDSTQLACTFSIDLFQGQLAGLLSNGPASHGMGPPGMGPPSSMLPPQHASPLVHPQEWMGQPPMNGLMSTPQPGLPHANMHDGRCVLLLLHHLLVVIHKHKHIYPQLLSVSDAAPQNIAGVLLTMLHVGTETCLKLFGAFMLTSLIALIAYQQVLSMHVQGIGIAFLTKSPWRGLPTRVLWA